MEFYTSLIAKSTPYKIWYRLPLLAFCAVLMQILVRNPRFPYQNPLRERGLRGNCILLLETLLVLINWNANKSHLYNTFKIRANSVDGCKGFLYNPLTDPTYFWGKRHAKQELCPRSLMKKNSSYKTFHIRVVLTTYSEE